MSDAAVALADAHTYFSYTSLPPPLSSLVAIQLEHVAPLLINNQPPRHVRPVEVEVVQTKHLSCMNKPDQGASIQTRGKHYQLPPKTKNFRKAEKTNIYNAKSDL